MSGCSTVTDLGVVRDVLATVDCNTRTFARLGYESLAAANSPFQVALTVALTIYVAVIGYRLLFGEGARLSDGPVIALKIGPCWRWCPAGACSRPWYSTWPSARRRKSRTSFPHPCAAGIRWRPIR